MLPKAHRVNRKEQFKQTLRKGRRFTINSPHIKITRNSNNLEYNRYGFIVTNKTGNAVTRNKIKRHLREITATVTNQTTGYDYVFMVTTPTGEYTYNNLKNTISKILQK